MSPPQADNAYKILLKLTKIRTDTAEKLYPNDTVGTGTMRHTFDQSTENIMLHNTTTSDASVTCSHSRYNISYDKYNNMPSMAMVMLRAVSCPSWRVTRQVYVPS